MQQAFVQRVAKPLALRQVEFSVLMLLAKNNRVTHKQLSTALAVAPSNMVGVVAGLERRHLIERVSNPADGRSFFWRLTDGGDKLQRCALETVSAMEADLLADWPRPERAEAHALLERLWTD
jgi:DNA-binding MarR family transcriptional regulator